MEQTKMLASGTKVKVVKDIVLGGTPTSLKGITGRVILADTLLGTVRIYQIETDRRTIFGRKVYVYPEEIEVIDASK